MKAIKNTVIKPIVLLKIYPIFSSLVPTIPPLNKREAPKEQTALHIIPFIDFKTILVVRFPSRKMGFELLLVVVKDFNNRSPLV